jgi:hypothetical protein
VFPRDMVCFRNISVDTLHKGDTEDDDDDDNNNNNNNNSLIYMCVHAEISATKGKVDVNITFYMILFSL